MYLCVCAKEKPHSFGIQRQDTDVWIWPKVAHPVYLEITPQNEHCLAPDALFGWKGVGRFSHILLLMHVKLPFKVVFLPKALNINFK